MQKLTRLYNFYYIIPFLVWVLTGGIILLVSDDATILRAINTHYTESLDMIMYYGTRMGQAEFIIPVLLAVMLFHRFRNWWYFATAVACNIIPLLLQMWLKIYFNHPRPLHYFYQASWLHFNTWWDQLFYKSFPSGHSEGAASFFCFLSLLLPQRFRYFGIMFFLLAMVVCYSRVYLAAHFFSDVYAGSILGCTTTLLLYAVMDKFRGNLENL